MSIQLSENESRVRYTLAQSVSQSVFAVPFEFFEDADLTVFVDSVVKVEGADYTVSGGGGSTGNITFLVALVGSTGGSIIEIVRRIAVERTTDFLPGADINRAALNQQLDTLTAMIGDVNDKADRSLRISDSDFGLTDLPNNATRKGKVLAFNESTGNVEAGPTISGVNTVSQLAAQIQTLAEIEDGTVATGAISTAAGIASDITTVAAIDSDVVTVAGVASDIPAVAGLASDFAAVAAILPAVSAVAAIDTDVVAVAANATDISAVAAIDSDVSTVAAIAPDVTTVAGIDADVVIVAGISADVASLGPVASGIATLEPIAADITTVAGIDADVSTVAGIASDVSAVAAIDTSVVTVAGIDTDVVAVAGNAANISTVAGISSDVSAVAAIDTDVTAVLGISADITTVAGIAPDVTTVAGISADVTVVAANIADINTKVPRTSATGAAVVPAGTAAQRDGTPLAGYFRFNSDVAKFEGYNGTAWGAVGGGATGGGNDEIFIENGQEVTTNYTIPATRNAMTTGPIDILAGVTVTVSAGARWVII